MPNILTNLNNGNSKNSKIRFISILVAIFIVFGSMGYFLVVLFAPTSETNTQSGTTTISRNPKGEETSYEGYVKFVDPNFYPNDEISFVLNDSGGDEIILLKADDQKLEVAEGHYVTAKGQVVSSNYGDFDYLIVEEVVIENVTN